MGAYCSSNKMVFYGMSVDDFHNEIYESQTATTLVELLNPNQNGTSGTTSKYYKMNCKPILQAQNMQTIEFRLQGSTSSFDEVEAWILLLLLFVRNSAGQA